MTAREAAIVMAYTGITIGPFSNLHAYAEEKLGRPIALHELPDVADELRVAAREDFINLVVETSTREPFECPCADCVESRRRDATRTRTTEIR